MSIFKEKIVVGVDAGGSSIKAVYFKEGKPVFFEIDNSLWEHDGYLSMSDCVDGNEDFDKTMDLMIEIQSEQTSEFKDKSVSIVNAINDKRWIIGELAKAVSLPKATKLNMSSKASQHHYYINILTAVVKAMEDLEVYDADVVLGVMLPPKQYFKHEKSIVGDVLNGKVSIFNNTNQRKYQIEFTEPVSVKSETVAAFLTAFVNSKGQPTEEIKEYFDTTCVIIDIGENTTDIAAVINGKPQPYAVNSYDYAAGLLLLMLKDEIYRKHDFELNLRQLREVFAKGYTHIGSKKIQMVNEISKANKTFANNLFEDFYQDYLIKTGINIKSIGAIIFIGGGSIKLPNVRSVGEHFMDRVHEKSKNTDQIDVKDFRLANIKGLALTLKH